MEDLTKEELIELKEKITSLSTKKKETLIINEKPKFISDEYSQHSH